jgi:predicted RNase H-like nuclease (RuvC/YqgF family)
MLDTETIKNISTFVEITMQVESRMRSKFEEKEERLTEDLEEAKAAYMDLDKQVFELEKQIKELEGQKDRQSQTIKELLDVRAQQANEINGLKKELEDWRVGIPPHTEELQQKLDKAMDHIRRQGEEIDKLRAGAADPRWIPLTSRYPDMGENVLVCTKRGTIYIAQETGEGWKNNTGKMAAPVAWMPLPAKYEEA